MRDWLADIPNLGVPGVPGVLPQKTVVFDRCSSVPPGVPGVPDHTLRTPGTLSGTQNTSCNILKSNEEHSEHQEHRENDAHELWRECSEQIANLDWSRPIPGYDIARASALRHDTVWLLENFAMQAFRDGWTVGELFGLWPDKPGWGGIADRLDGSRSLKMTADRAHWRCGVTGDARQFNRGAYGDLTPFWEVGG